MNERTLRKLIDALRKVGHEWETVDAKHELVLQQLGDKAEFTKDIIALANNQRPSYLVIGLSEPDYEDVGDLSYHYTTNDLNQILADKIDPVLVVEYEEFRIGTNEYALVGVVGTNPPYLAACDVISQRADRKKARVYKGTIFIRHKDRTVGVSRAELDALFENRGIRQAFMDETKHAQHLAFDQPDLWEYRLLAELLRTNLDRARTRYEDIRRGATFTKAIKVSGTEFLDFAQTKCHDLVTLIEFFRLAVVERIPASFSSPDQMGNPMKIRNTVQHIMSGCEHLLDWEREMRAVMAPSPLSHLKEMMSGWTTPLFDTLSSIPFQLERILENPDAAGPFEIVAVFSAPSNTHEFQAELDRLLKHKSEWVDSF